MKPANKNTRDTLYGKKICKAFCIKIKPFFMRSGMMNKLSCPLFRERDKERRRDKSEIKVYKVTNKGEKRKTDWNSWERLEQLRRRN